MNTNKIEASTLSFDPATGALEIRLEGKTLSATVSTDELAASPWAPAIAVIDLLAPVWKEQDALWDQVESAADIERLQATAAVLTDVLALVYHWVTTSINSLDQVRRLHHQDLCALAKSCHAHALAQPRAKVAA